MTSSNDYPTRTWVNRGLSRKFLIILVLGAAVTTVCSALFGYYHGYELRRESVAMLMQHSAESLAAQIDTSLDAAVQLLTQLTASRELQRAVIDESEEAADRAREALVKFAGRNPGFQAIKAVDETRKFASFKELPVDVTSQRRTAIFKPTSGQGLDPATVLICVPILSGESEDFKGELHAAYSLASVLPRWAKSNQNMVGLLLAEQGNRQLHIIGPSHLTSSQSTVFQERDGMISLKETGWSSVEFPQFEMKALAGFAPIRHSLTPAPRMHGSRNWSVVTTTPQSHVAMPLNSLFFQALAFSGGILVLISLVGLAFAQRTLGPIRILEAGVRQIGQGNLEHRIDIRSGDEIEILAFEFNRMADRMQRTQEQLQRRGEKLKQRVNQLRRLQTQLTQSERMAATGELAAQIAHEINNPLGIIKNYVGIARMLMPEEDSNRENLKIVDQEINRIAGIVRRLLKFAKPGMEDIQSVQINPILEELLALLRGQLFRRKIEVLVELGENLPEVNLSTDQMRQVFLNLIKNAEDAMLEGGKLSVRTRYRKGHVEIDIADDGCGIPPEDVKNIFEPFFTTKGVKGTGLGLSVSYGIIKNYNGEISVDSEPGRGTTFTIQLPVVSDKVFQVIQSP